MCRFISEYVCIAQLFLEFVKNNITGREEGQFFLFYIWDKIYMSMKKVNIMNNKNVSEYWTVNSYALDNVNKTVST
jgi:hypothetical protein